MQLSCNISLREATIGASVFHALRDDKLALVMRHAQCIDGAAEEMTHGVSPMEQRS